MVGAVEDVVGRHLYQPAATTLDSLCQIAGSHMVQQVAQLLVVLCLVNGSIGGTVDDAVNLMVVDERTNGFRIGNIQLCHIRIIIGMLGIHLLQQLHLVSQLAVTACNQNVHLFKF